MATRSPQDNKVKEWSWVGVIIGLAYLVAISGAIIALSYYSGWSRVAAIAAIVLALSLLGTSSRFTVPLNDLSKAVINLSKSIDDKLLLGVGAGAWPRIIGGLLTWVAFTLMAFADIAVLSTSYANAVSPPQAVQVNQFASTPANPGPPQAGSPPEPNPGGDGPPGAKFGKEENDGGGSNTTAGEGEGASLSLNPNNNRFFLAFASFAIEFVIGHIIAHSFGLAGDWFPKLKRPQRIVLFGLGAAAFCLIATAQLNAAQTFPAGTMLTTLYRQRVELETAAAKTAGVQAVGSQGPSSDTLDRPTVDKPTSPRSEDKGSDNLSPYTNLPQDAGAIDAAYKIISKSEIVADRSRTLEWIVMAMAFGSLLIGLVFSSAIESLTLIVRVALVGIGFVVSPIVRALGHLVAWVSALIELPADSYSGAATRWNQYRRRSAIIEAFRSAGNRQNPSEALVEEVLHEMEMLADPATPLRQYRLMRIDLMLGQDVPTESLTDNSAKFLGYLDPPTLAKVGVPRIARCMRDSDEFAALAYVANLDSIEAHTIDEAILRVKFLAVADYPQINDRSLELLGNPGNMTAQQYEPFKVAIGKWRSFYGGFDDLKDLLRTGFDEASWARSSDTPYVDFFRLMLGREDVVLESYRAFFQEYRSLSKAALSAGYRSSIVPRGALLPEATYGDMRIIRQAATNIRRLNAMLLGSFKLLRSGIVLSLAPCFSLDEAAFESWLRTITAEEPGQ